MKRYNCREDCCVPCCQICAVPRPCQDPPGRMEPQVPPDLQVRPGHGPQAGRGLGRAAPTTRGAGATGPTGPTGVTSYRAALPGEGRGRSRQGAGPAGSRATAYGAGGAAGPTGHRPDRQYSAKPL